MDGLDLYVKQRIQNMEELWDRLYVEPEKQKKVVQKIPVQVSQPQSVWEPIPDEFLDDSFQPSEAVPIPELKEKVKKYINIAKGQLEGIVRMIDEDRYCLEISDQLMATRSLLKKTNNLILKNHIDNCVKDALSDGDTDKLEEVIKALEKQI